MLGRYVAALTKRYFACILGLAAEYQQAAFTHPEQRCRPPSNLLFGCVQNIGAAAPHHEKNRPNRQKFRIRATSSAIGLHDNRRKVPFSGRHRELEMGLDGLLVVARTPPPLPPLCVVHSQLPDGNVSSSRPHPPRGRPPGMTSKRG
jgi:hypothetical protein